MNHFAKTSQGVTLASITMAGGGEHSDSWILVGHRVPADVEKGSFKLRTVIGSRQWGGREADIDIELGAL